MPTYLSPKKEKPREKHCVSVVAHHKEVEFSRLFATFMKAIPTVSQESRSNG